MEEYSEYEFEVKFENFAGLQESERFSISTRSTIGSSVKVSAEQQYQFKNYIQNEIVMNIEYLDCSSSNILEIDKELGLEWYDISGGRLSLLNQT